MSKTIIDKMVNRFLGWKLPKDFYPDAGISFTPTNPYEGDAFGNSWWPVGTNLFTADQAKQMFEYALGDDLHGECAAEIHALQAKVKELESLGEPEALHIAYESGRASANKQIRELTAHCERLREALILCSSFIGDAAGFDPYGSEKDLAEFLQQVKREELEAAAKAKEALAATPAQSLAKLKAETLRWCLNEYFRDGGDMALGDFMLKRADELEGKSC